MNWRGALLPGLILVLGTLLPAQEQGLGAPVITNYETEQFKAFSQNWAALQDRRGIMYFANNAGILEFDGQHWERIPVPGNTTVRDLALGPDGTVYYGSVDDFGYLASSATGKVSAVSLGGAIPRDARAFNDVWQVASSADGIYFLTRSRIFRFHGGRVTTLPGKFASSQACLLNGTVFYADTEKGLCLLAGDEVLPIRQLGGIYNGTRIALAPSGRHQLLVGRVSGDFLRIDLSAFWDDASRRYDVSRPAPREMVQAFPCELDAFIKGSNAFLYKLVPLGAGAFAICTVKGGIVSFDGSGKIIRSINTNSGLLDNTVTNLFVDRAGDLWACNNAGISHIELNGPQSYFGPRNNIRGISTCARFYNGRMYVGSFENLLVQLPYRFALQDDKPVFKALINSPAQVWQFLEVGGDLMAATANGLFRIQGEEAVEVQGSDSIAYCMVVSRRWPDHLFTGLVGGMEVYRRSAGQWRLLGRMEAVHDTIRGIAQDANGDLWAGTESGGLLRLHFSGADPTRSAIDRFGPEQGLPVRSYLLAVVRGDALFVLSSAGLFRATIPLGAAQAPERIRFAPDTNLGRTFVNPAVGLKDMIFSPGGGVFFNTADGAVWAIPGRDGQFRMESRPFRGMPAQDGAMYLHPDGSVWLPGKGLYRVDPKVAKDYDQPFAVLVRKMTVNSKRFLFEGTHARPGEAFGRQRTVFTSGQDPAAIPQLPYRENSAAFEFAAAFYEKPGGTRFQYYLEGFDKEWSAWTAETKKEYTNLPEGRYCFRVRAKNVYGTMGREAEYRLRILPPWYRTLWAYFIWISGSIIALLGIVYLYTLSLRRQKDHLEVIVAERTQQLHEASEFLLQATLTDPLTGLRNRRFMHEVLQNDVAAFIKRKQYLLNAKNHREAVLENAVFGLFLMDIDFFKRVNDAHGHDAGDRVLKQFAALLMDSVRQDDAVLRMGGEEFLVVLKRVVPDHLAIFAAKILEKVAATHFDIGGGVSVRKTCSIGYVSLPVYWEQPGLLTFEQSTMIADLGLFYAKGHGRNQGILLQAGPRLPSGKEIIQKTATSLEFALNEGYLRIFDAVAGAKP